MVSLSFSDLPAEIVLQVIENLRSARDISHLSRLNRRFHSLVEKDGYRVFLQHAYPCTPVPAPTEYAGHNGPFFKDAAHSLTTLSRNWERKAVVAHQILPFSVSPSHRYGFRSRQTMGFTPVLDSREEWYGGDWRDRFQVVACGAGAQLYLQMTNLVKDLYSSGQTPSVPYHPRFSIYDEKGTLDGRDDISAVKLLPQTVSGRQDIVVGRCNGNLELISYEKRKDRFRLRAMLKAGGPPVKSIALNSNRILAVASSDRTVGFYDMNDELKDSHLLHVIPLPQPQQMTRTHTITWLDDNRLAVGSASTPDPAEIFDIQGQSLRRFTLSLNESVPSDAVYSLATVHGSSLLQKESYDNFLSGSYYGRVRRHDLRSPSPAVATFEDNIDYSTVYSLTAYGQERFVAGGTSGLLKVFDLRKPKVRLLDRASSARTSPNIHQDSHACGWNIFLSGQRWPAVSPVYALSKPADSSPTLFAGIEGTVFQLDITSTTDKFPDPVYGKMPDTGHRGHDIRLKWASKRRPLQLSMYEHPKSTTETVKLRKQRPVGCYDSIIPGWDARWR